MNGHPNFFQRPPMRPPFHGRVAGPYQDYGVPGARPPFPFPPSAGPPRHHNPNQPHPQRFREVDKPWVSPALKREIYRRVNLGKLAKKSRKAEDVEAFTQQKRKVENLLEDARNVWLSQNPHCEEKWLQVLAEEDRHRRYWCEVCEKGFPTGPELAQHESEHTTCGVDGCKYTAHASVLEMHILHQHVSGLYNQIPQGDTPEEVAKWRAERRKNFPTREKVEEKEAAEAEMRARGEVMRLEKLRKRRQKEEEERRMNPDRPQEDAKDPVADEPEWECNCKARFVIQSLRGLQGRRGRAGASRGAARAALRNIRHQRHCQELENIRRRIKEKEERRKETQFKQTESDYLMPIKDDIASSDEDDIPQGQQRRHFSGLYMFSGVGGLTAFNSSSNGADGGSADISSDNDGADNVAEDDVGFEISDDDDDIWESKKSSSKGGVADIVDSDDETEAAVQRDHYAPASDILTVQEEVLDEEEARNERDEAAYDPHPGTSKDEALNVGGDSDSDDGPPEEVPIEKSTDCLSANEDDNNDAVGKSAKSSSDAGDVIGSGQGDDNASAGSSRHRKRRRHHNKKGADDAKPSADDQGTAGDANKRLKVGVQPARNVFRKAIRPPTLLERLLSDEISSERNVILQCVRYVCQKNFFMAEKDAGAETPESNPTPTALSPSQDQSSTS